MELGIEPLPSGDGHTWTIVYEGGGKRQVRPYEIHPVDAKTGHYRVDEKNSIVLDAYLVGPALHSRFEVGTSVIDVRYAMRDGAIDVVLTTYGKAPVSTTGGEGRVSPVHAYPLLAVQTATLRRVEPR